MKKFFFKLWHYLNFSVATILLGPWLFLYNRIEDFFRSRADAHVISRAWAKWLNTLVKTEHKEDYLEKNIHKYWIFINMGISTILCGISVILIGALDSKKRVCRQIARAWAKWNIWIIGVEYHVYEIEHINKKGQYVFVSNHQSLLDALIIYLILPVNATVLAKKEVFKVPIFGQAIKLLGIISVDREDKQQRKEAIKQAVKRIKKTGQSVLYFVEGTRGSNSELLPFKSGAYRTAILLKLPIITITVIGTREALPANTLELDKTVKVSIIFDKPVLTKYQEDADIPELIEKTRNQIIGNLKNAKKNSP